MGYKGVISYIHEVNSTRVLMTTEVSKRGKTGTQQME